jgi:hypothetical protein
MTSFLIIQTVKKVKKKKKGITWKSSLIFLSKTSIKIKINVKKEGGKFKIFNTDGTG